MLKLALSLSLVVASTALAAPALASGVEAKSVAVKVSDLNLSTDAGVRTLYGRIQAAAREACKGVESRSAATQVEHKTCMRTALDSGVKAAGSEALSALHLAKAGASSGAIAAK